MLGRESLFLPAGALRDPVHDVIAFELNDPITTWLPEFAETRVYVAGSAQKRRPE